MHVNLVSVAKPMSQFQTYRPFLGNAAHPRLPMAPKSIVSTRLGQQLPPITAETTVLKDLSAPISADQWAAQAWTKEQAIATFNVANLLWSIREKIAFSAVFFRDLVADPRTLATINSSGNSGEFISVTNELAKISQMLSLPNLMASVRNILEALEIRILPKFGVGVRGKRPLLRGPNSPMPNILDCITTDTSGGKSEVIDFGDLCNTSVLADLDALQVSTRSVEEIAPEIKLSGATLGAPIVIAPIVIFLIKAAAWIGGILLVGKVVALPSLDKVGEIADKFMANPAMLDAIKGITDPVKRAELIERYLKGQTLWQSIEKTAMWVAIALGAIAAAAIVYAIVKPSSATASPQPLPEARTNGRSTPQPLPEARTNGRSAPQPLPEARGNGKREEETKKVSRLNYVN